LFFSQMRLSQATIAAITLLDVGANIGT